MKSRDYWKKRSEEVAAKQFKKTDDYLFRMQLEYQEALSSIQKDIEVFYARFAQNNEISLADAKQLLNSNQLQEFKMNLKEFRNKAKNNSDGIWDQELNNVYYKTRVTRLQALQAQIKARINNLYSSQSEGTTELLKEVYKDTYYRNIFEIHKGLGIGVNFAKLDDKAVDKVMAENWHGGNYSSRIWSNTEKLAMELQTNLTQAFIRGDSIDKASKIIADRMNVAKSRAITLVSTESAYITSKATFDSYGGSGVVKQYEILATLDLRTSTICRWMDGKVFNISEKEIGVNAPPFHPRCRTTTIPYFPDAIDEERIARYHEGKTYKVDDNMDYEQWYNKYVKGNLKEEIAEKKLQNKSSDKKQHENYREVLGKEVPRSFDKFQELKYNDSEQYSNLKINYRKINAYNKVTLNEPEITKDLQDISKITNTELVGLEFRLKTKESYLRKVNMDSKNSLDSKIIQETIDNTNDIIRYTYQSSYEQLVDKYFEINNYLTEKGYAPIKVKNTWLIKANPYKGINCNYIAPSGQKFEIQYHTPESFELKNGELHSLYEKWRVINDKSSVKAIELSKKMTELSSKLKYPSKIDKVR